MPRRREVPKRQILPDPKFGDQQIAKFINMIMRSGKKSTAERSVYAAFDRVNERSDAPALEVFNAAITNCSPRLEVRTRRVGGANYQVPYEVPQDRQISLALRWIVRAARERSGHTMGGRLAAEIMDAARKEGKAYNKRLDVHRMAEANRAFAHYRW